MTLSDHKELCREQKRGGYEKKENSEPKILSLKHTRTKNVLTSVVALSSVAQVSANHGFLFITELDSIHGYRIEATEASTVCWSSVRKSDTCQQQGNSTSHKFEG